MDPTTGKHKQEPGLPDPASVIETVKFTPQQKAAGGQGLLPTPTKRQTYRILKTTEMDAYDTTTAGAGPEALLSAAPPVPTGDAFHGTSRKAAKLSIGTGAVEVMPDLQDLITSLTPDANMINHNPPISDTASSTRAAEEERNVQVQAFLYASSRESDNDFHLIVGRDRALDPHQYMTMEVSGLPTRTSPTYATLKAARDAFKNFFGTKLPGTRYDFYDPPIPIQIQGSLLFDIHHATGPHPGPPSLEPDMPTIWEVHPVTSIVFEPGP